MTAGSSTFVAGARARLFVNKVDAIGTALRGKFIDADGAIAQLAELGVDLIVPSSIVAGSSVVS
jgi:hypothetical protein